MPGRPMLLCAQKGEPGALVVDRPANRSRPGEAAMVALAAAAAVMAQPRAQRR
jgi:hypothetical protein